MSEFKFACPFCNQHISCDSSQAASEMDCPTCFQKIIVPTPMSTDSKLIVTGFKASAPPTRAAGTKFQPPKNPAPKNFPGSLVVAVILIFVCAVAAFIYHGTIFRAPAAAAPGTNQISNATNSAMTNTNAPAK